MLQNGNSGLKMGVSREAHTQYAYIMEVPPPPRVSVFMLYAAVTSSRKVTQDNFRELEQDVARCMSCQLRAPLDSYSTYRQMRKGTSFFPLPPPPLPKSLNRSGGGGGGRGTFYLEGRPIKNNTDGHSVLHDNCRRI